VNAPSNETDEWNIGMEWQIKKQFELVCEYLITDRTNLRARSSGRSYEQFEGEVLRFQFQINY
jgi:phosphate-selective porin